MAQAARRMADIIPLSPNGPVTINDVVAQELGKAHDLVSWLGQHLSVAILWGWISLSLILHIWLARRRVGWFRKVIWSCIVLMPLLGWLFYGAFFSVPGDKGHTRAGMGIDTGGVTGGSVDSHHDGAGHF